MQSVISQFRFFAANLATHFFQSKEDHPIHGGDASMEGCSHCNEYKTGNYRKKKIGFIWSIDEEYYCPNYGYRHYVLDISFS